LRREQWLNRSIATQSFKAAVSKNRGHTKQIQEEHYLRIMDDDHREAMCNWRDSQKGSSKGSRTDGSHLSAMVFKALRKVGPELVSAAEKHAAGMTKIGLNGMFESTEVPLVNGG
jgi:hypothetical protein